MDSAAEAVGSFARLGALPMTVRLTDVTVDAVTGTVSCASIWRGADFASIAPRSQADVPSEPPQPKLMLGTPPLAGVAASRTVASDTLPPVVHSLTVHWAACPRSLVAWAAATLTQRLGCVVYCTVLAPLCVLVAVAVGVLVGVLDGGGVFVGVLDGVGVGVALAVALVQVALVGVPAGEVVAEALTMARVVVTDADGRALGVGFAVDFVAVAEGLDFSVRVGAGVAFAEVVAVALGWVGVGFAVGLVAVGVGVVGVGVVGVGVGVGDPEEGELDGVGGVDGAADCAKGSHDSLLDVVAAFAAVLVARVRLTPEAAVTKTLPAIRVTVAGRACAKRMKTPYQCCSSWYAPQWTSSALKGATRSLTLLSLRITTLAVFASGL
jgi:hypothetical protein